MEQTSSNGTEPIEGQHTPPQPITSRRVKDDRQVVTLPDEPAAFHRVSIGRGKWALMHMGMNRARRRAKAAADRAAKRRAKRTARVKACRAQRKAAAMMTLDQAIAAIRGYEVTPAEREEQLRSFAYGNAAISNPNVTREMVDRAAEELAREAGGNGE